MKTLPAELVAYKRTPTFSHTSVPNRLLKAHNTKAGTWGKIVVVDGELLYSILEPEREDIDLSPELHGIIEPEILHQVMPIGEVYFYVEFYR